METVSTKLNLRHAHAFACDGSFEAQLLDRIVIAIADTSMLDHGAGEPVLVLRTGETASALVSALASVLALSPPAAHGSNAIKQTSQSFRRQLHSQVRQATRDPHLHDFLRRTFNYTDRARGGRA